MQADLCVCGCVCVCNPVRKKANLSEILYFNFMQKQNVLPAVAALRRHRCCILRATLRRQRRIQLSQPQNKLGRGTASIGGGDDDGRAHTRLPPPTHTHTWASSKTLWKKLKRVA